MVNYDINIERNTHNSLECKGFELVNQGVCVCVYSDLISYFLVYQQNSQVKKPDQKNQTRHFVVVIFNLSK